MSAKKPSDIVTRIKELKSFPAVSLITCKDRIRKERVLALCLEQFFKNEDIPEQRRISAKTLNQATLSTLQDSLHSQSLFSKREIYLISDCEELNAADAKALAKVLAEPNLTADVMLWAESLGTTHALSKLCLNHETLFELAELKGQELKRWTARELKMADITEFEANSLELLLRLAGESLDKLHAYIEQIALFLDGDKLNTAHLHSIFTEQIEPSEFELIDALQNPKSQIVELLLKKNLDAGKSPFALIGLISRVFSNYINIVFLANSGSNPHAIREALKMNSWVFNKNYTAAKRYSLERLTDIQRSIVKADSKLKNRSLGPDLVLAELLSDLAA